jgi:hypothetical protein
MRAIFAVDGGNATGLAWGIFDDRARSVEEAVKNRLHSGSMTINHRVRRNGKMVVEDPHDDMQQIARIMKEFILFKRKAVNECRLNPEWVDLVIEDFILMPGQHSGGRDGVASVRIAWGLTGLQMGMWTEYARRHKHFHVSEPIWQPPSVMGRVKDDHLRRYGVWVPGRDHERAAWRHICFRLNQILK